MNRAERRKQQKKGHKGQGEPKVGPGQKPLNVRDFGRRPERGLTRHVSQQKGRGS
jgi:hypothetical protein